MFEPSYEFYDPFLFRRLFKPGKPVRRQQTCPVCGRTLVNTYKRNGTWKCRRCWEEVNKKMKCCRCGKPFYECKAMHPIDPKGTKGRRWVCLDCETEEENAKVDPEVKEFERMILEAAP